MPDMPKWMLRHKCSGCLMGQGECHQMWIIDRQCCDICNHVKDGPWTIEEIQEMWAGKPMPYWVRDHVNRLKAERDKDLQTKAGFPTPGTASPKYEIYAGSIIRTTHDAITVNVPKPRAAFRSFGEDKFEEYLEPSYTTLARKKWWGPAPFVGDPLTHRAGYVWFVWVDSEWNFIAGDAELRIEEAYP